MNRFEIFVFKKYHDLETQVTQSRSLETTPSDRYDVLLMFNSNSIFHHFWRIWFRKILRPWILVRSHSRSSKLVPFDI